MKPRKERRAPKHVPMPTIVFGARCKGKITEMAVRLTVPVEEHEKIEIEWMMRYDNKPYGARLPYNPDDPDDFVNGCLRCLEHAGQTVAALDAQSAKSGQDTVQ